MNDAIEMMRLDAIKPYENNPRKNGGAVDAVAASIREFGFRNPILVDKDSVVIAGHTRLLAAIRLGLDKVPVIVCDDLDDERVRALRLADNKTAELAEWDEDKLAEEIASIVGMDMDEFGFEVAEEEERKTDADAIPEAPEEARSVRGEIYRLGRHRLMCGDSTSEEDVARLMCGEKADMVFTDPPYNVSIGDRNAAINAEVEKNGRKNKGGRIERNILGDVGMTDEECGEKLWKPAFSNMQKFAAEHCAIYVTMPQGGTHMMMMMMMRSSWKVKHELIWLKDQPTFSMGRLDYDYKHEPICYGWNKTHRFFGEGEFTKSVWEIPKPRASKDHPTMKPVELVENALLNSSLENEIVMDLFGGSGTTALACEMRNRCARLMELDPHYCDVIRRRWAEFVNGEGCDWEALTPRVAHSGQDEA